MTVSPCKDCIVFESKWMRCEHTNRDLTKVYAGLKLTDKPITRTIKMFDKNKGEVDGNE